MERPYSVGRVSAFSRLLLRAVYLAGSVAGVDRPWRRRGVGGFRDKLSWCNVGNGVGRTLRKGSIALESLPTRASRRLLDALTSYTTLHSPMAATVGDRKSTRLNSSH